ncbi:hypothetical protein HOLleu_28172 [Holothuria leucospilota]|uniref:Uncharacterized protein n=1 Tax=Holothuria leucospilota TaxID=206669 RepID=A0A9Q1BLN9_HOLLE|nr:hypothetical protein HOLleu_28172 [Holothuria leucospilota]
MAFISVHGSERGSKAHYSRAQKKVMETVHHQSAISDHAHNQVGHKAGQRRGICQQLGLPRLTPPFLPQQPSQKS